MTGPVDLLRLAAAGQSDPNDMPCQRWNRRVDSWRRTSEGGFDPRRYRVAPVGEAAARAFVAAHHYSGSLPAVRLRGGIFEGRHLVGVATLGIPATRAVLTAPFPTLVPYVQSLELNRLVLWDVVPANAESWFVAQVFAGARRAGLRGVVAYSDPVPRVTVGQRVVMPGHVGVVYQALSGVPVGRSAERARLHLPDGWVLPGRAVTKIRKGESGAGGAVERLRGYGVALPSYDQAAAAASWAGGGQPAARYGPRWMAEAVGLLTASAGARTVRHPGCYRYVWLLGTRRQREQTAMPLAATGYPKRHEPSTTMEGTYS